MDHREEKLITHRTKQANFPHIKSIETFDFAAIPTLNRSRILVFMRGDYLDERRQVILMGNSQEQAKHILPLS